MLRLSCNYCALQVSLMYTDEFFPDNPGLKPSVRGKRAPSEEEAAAMAAAASAAEAAAMPKRSRGRPSKWKVRSSVFIGP